MTQGLGWLQIRSTRQVLMGTVLITAIAVSAPVLTLLGVLTLVMGLHPFHYLGILAIAAIIPLLIAPPISLFALSILRVLTVTLDRLDAHVRFDPLTGVLTRAYFLGQVRDQIARAGGVFLMADADHFKVINDTYGHDIGDEALKRLAEVLRGSVPMDVPIGRLGGEEFGIFLPGAGRDEAAATAGRICEAMRRGGKYVAGHELALTLTIGAAAHFDHDSLEETMKRADAALYHAKRTGRDRYHVSGGDEFTPARRRQGQSRRSAERSAAGD